MTVDTWRRNVGTVVALGLAVVGVMLGLGFLPSRAEAFESGRIVPWMIAWGLTLVAVLSAVTVAGFLVATAGGQSGRSTH